jgi:hypothetical protein
MDKERVAALAARGEQIKTNSSEFCGFAAGSDDRCYRTSRSSKDPPGRRRRPQARTTRGVNHPPHPRRTNSRRLTDGNGCIWF